MNVSSRRYANAVLVQVSGRLDQDTCEAFRGQLMTFVDQAAHDGGAIVLDLSQLEYVSSAGLRCLMMAARQASAHESRIMVAAPQPVVAEILQISRFNLVLQVFGTTREALASVSPEAARAYEQA